MKQDERWLVQWKEVLDFMETNNRRPSKFVDSERGLRNWWKHQQELLNAGELKPERKEKFFLLLRQYQEEMLDAFLQDDDYFPELLHYCNSLFEMLPTILEASQWKSDRDASRLAAIALVAAGYGGDMDEDLCNEILDDMDYHNNRVKCRAIEQIMPQLMHMVESEI